MAVSIFVSQPIYGDQPSENPASYRYAFASVRCSVFLPGNTVYGIAEQKKGLVRGRVYLCGDDCICVCIVSAASMSDYGTSCAGNRK